MYFKRLKEVSHACVQQEWNEMKERLINEDEKFSAEDREERNLMAKRIPATVLSEKPWNR